MEYMFAAAFIATSIGLSIVYFIQGDKQLDGGKYLVKETKWNMSINPRPFFKLKVVVEQAHRQEKINVLCKILTMRLLRIPNDIFQDIKLLNLDQLDFLVDRCLKYKNYESVRMDLIDLLQSKEVL